MAFLLEDPAGEWQQLSDPPAFALQSVVITAPGTQTSRDRLVVLGPADHETLGLATYDVDADTWATRTVATLAPGGLPEGPAFTASSDGADTVWFQSFADHSLLLSLDVPTGDLQVVEPPEPVLATLPIAFPGGVFLTRGEPIPGLDDEATPGPDAAGALHHVQRWVPEDGPLPTPAPTREIGTGGMLGLDEVLPVIDGDWTELVPPVDVGPDPGPPAVALWTGLEVVVIDHEVVQTLDPSTASWRRLPDLPLPDPSTPVQGVVVDGTVVVAATAAVQPPPVEPARADAWALVEGGWQAVTSIPDGVQLLGAVDGQIISARSSGEEPVPPVQLWASDPAAEHPRRLPDPPRPVSFADVVDTPVGFVLLGEHLTGGTGTDEAPFTFERVGAQWDGSAWTALDVPAGPPGEAGAVWVPSVPLSTGDPPPEGAVLVVSEIADAIEFTGIELTTGDTTAIPLPMTDALRQRLPLGDLAVTWDGADTVWIYGGYGSAVHLALDLPTGDVHVALG